MKMTKQKDFDQFPKLYWEEYIFRCDEYNVENIKEFNKKKKYHEELKQFLDNNKELQGITGEQAQEINLGKFGNYSWRAWGAMMAAYMNSKIGKRKYHYMSFYM